MAKPSAPAPKDLASQLLEAEVAFWMQNLKGKKFQALLSPCALLIICETTGLWYWVPLPHKFVALCCPIGVIHSNQYLR